MKALWIALVVVLVGFIVHFANDIFQHGVEAGYQARIEQEKEEVFKRNLCIDWSHENATNARMAKKAMGK